MNRTKIRPIHEVIADRYNELKKAFIETVEANEIFDMEYVHEMNQHLEWLTLNGHISNLTIRGKVMGDHPNSRCYPIYEIKGAGTVCPEQMESILCRDKMDAETLKSIHDKIFKDIHTVEPVKIKGVDITEEAQNELLFKFFYDSFGLSYMDIMNLIHEFNTLDSPFCMQNLKENDEWERVDRLIKRLEGDISQSDQGGNVFVSKSDGDRYIKICDKKAFIEFLYLTEKQ